MPQRLLIALGFARATDAFVSTSTRAHEVTRRRAHRTREPVRAITKSMASIDPLRDSVGE